MSVQVHAINIDLKASPQETGRQIAMQVIRPIVLQLRQGGMTDEAAFRLWMGLMGSLSGGMSADLGVEQAKYVMALLQEIVTEHQEVGAAEMLANRYGVKTH